MGCLVKLKQAMNASIYGHRLVFCFSILLFVEAYK
jgi:hypothetical protein